MQHIDPELFTWLFIGAVGLVAGVWGFDPSSVAAPR